MIDFQHITKDCTVQLLGLTEKLLTGRDAVISDQVTILSGNIFVIKLSYLDDSIPVSTHDQLMHADNILSETRDFFFSFPSALIADLVAISFWSLWGYVVYMKAALKSAVAN